MTTGTLHKPCPKCGSSDALAEYDDGPYCFSCGTKFPLDKSDKVCYNIPVVAEGGLYRSQSSESNMILKPVLLSWRGLTTDTMKRYDVLTYVDSSNSPIKIKFPYGAAVRKVRSIGKKEFYVEGSFKDADTLLFGMDKFPPGSANAITISEGELDAMSVYQMMGSMYPSVSIRSGAQAARRDCEEAYKYIDSFDKIVVCFDNDEPGREAARKVASLFDVNKVHIMELDRGLKDANEYLTNGKAKEFAKAWWNAKKYHPKNIVESFTDVRTILASTDKQAVASYPFPDLESMTYGIRHGEVNLILAQEGIGKTEIIRAIEYHLLKTCDDNIGVVHLEESEKRSIQGLLSYEFKRPVHLLGPTISVDELMAMYTDLVKREGRLFFYTHFGSDDPDTILNAIRYMVTVGHCKHVFFDHITMLVTGFEGDDERKKLDYVSTRLAMLTRELDFTLFMISHVNDDGKTRGSRNISKVSDLVISLERDLTSESENVRNTTRLMVVKNRFGGKTGPADELFFDHESFTLAPKTQIEIVDGETPF